MKRRISAISILIAFFLGCSASYVAPLVVPPARAQATTQKWEYFSFELRKRGDTIHQDLNQAGAQGWEVFMVDWPIAIAKRPVP